MTTTITANAGNASAAKVRADLLRAAALKPLAIGRQEVADRRGEDVPGYRTIQYAGPVKGHVALLVRRDAKPRNVRLHQIGKRTHVGRDVAGARTNGWTAAKYILAVDLTDPATGQDFTAATMHLVPSASHSKAASRLLATQAANAASWLAAQPLPTDLMGDCNGQAGRHEFAPLRKVATPLSAPSRKGAAIDIHWVKGGIGKATALDGYSSDHKPVVADITWAAKPAPKPPHKEKPVKFAAPAPTYLGPAAHTSAGRNKPITRIVIHSTVSACKPGGAQAIARYFRGQSAGGSAHYVVDPAGSVQVVWDDVIAWHAPPNAHSLGVELCDTPGTDSAHKASVKRWDDKNHTAMLDHAAELVAGLCLAYDVPIRKIGPGQLKAGQHGICGHADVSEAWHQSTHWDPGNFPWPRFIAMVKAKADAMKSNAAPKPEAKPKPKPAPTPAPAPKPKLEQDTIDGARTISKRAAKHGNKHRASKWRSIWRAMLGRKSS
jgi:endonuclease/exonuclease/phosphatase family metal-dependent hydrolase